MSERSLGGGSVVLQGAVDMHIHFGPEPSVMRLSGSSPTVDPIEAARDAADLGMAAIVLKPHEFASCLAAYHARQAVPSVGVFAGMCCDHPMGGINPAAVETALRGGAKVIWLPTISSRQTSAEQLSFLFGVTEGIPVTDRDGRLLAPVRAVMELVAEYDAVLATGHITKAEHVAVVREFGRQGRIVVTHAMLRGFGPELSPPECVELADLGALIEFAAHTCMGTPAGLAHTAAAIQAVGPERVILSTDYGWSPAEPRLPRPAAGFRRYIDALWEAGATEGQLRQMACDNPARLLGLIG